MADSKDALTSVIDKFDVGTLVRWVLPFVLILCGLLGYFVLHPLPWFAKEIDLSVLPKQTRTYIAVATLGCAIAGPLLLAFAMLYSVSGLVGQWAKSKQLEAIQSQRRKKIEEEFDSLGRDEIAMVGICLRRNTKTFTSNVTSSAASKLCQRGILTYRAGVVNVLEFPFSFQNEAWRYMTEHRDELLTKWKIADLDEETVQTLWSRLVF